MSAMFSSLMPFVFFSAYCHIYFDFIKKDALCYLFKPLTTLLIMGLAYKQTSTFTAVHYWVFAGLFFSLIGDIFLMLKKDYFLQGLIAFFVAHVAYVVAFLDPIGFVFNAYIIGFVALYAALLIAILNKHLGKLRIPVYFYALVLMLMVITSYNFFQLSWHYYSLYAFVGALFFMVSDSILALRKFVKEWPWSQPAILSTYYIAQTMIALSLTN